MQNIIEDILFQESPQKNPKLEILKTHFPECFDKEGKLLVDKLEKSLMGGGGVEFSKESYSLNWLGKSYASVLRNDPPTTWIKPDNAFNSTHPNSQNFLIKGDNLEALKLLKNAYEKKIKMIYIDPPYNTGSDGFVYTDDYKYTPKKLSGLCGMSEEDCKKMLEYYSKGKNSHSAWLTFMYPRLSLARNLLKEDGVIFISIDDNEQAQLKLLCDEIFGEENFVATLHIELSTTQGMKVSSAQKGNIVKNGEFVLVYAKNIFSSFLVNSLYVPRPYDDHYSIYMDEKDLKRQTLLDFIKQYYTNITKKEIIKKYSEDQEFRNFIHSYANNIFMDGNCNVNLQLDKDDEKKLDEGATIQKDSYLIFKTSGGTIRQLIPLSKSIGKTDGFDNGFGLRKIRGDWWEDYYRDMGNINSEGNIVFKNGKKPIRLIRDILKISTGKNDIILDFFAGSGTTAHAVMELNAEDGGNRNFILVQIDEKITNKGSDNKELYDFVKNTLGIDEPKISDITQERIIRASKQIQEKYPEYQGDLGFQVFELEEIPSELAEIRQSNFEKINHLFANEDIDKMLDIEAILQSFCLYDSIPLGAELEKVDLGGYIAYKFQERIYLLHQGFQTKHLQEFLRKMDDEESFCVGEIVLLAYCFESARRREIAEAISYYNKKSRELKIVVRG